MLAILHVGARPAFSSEWVPPEVQVRPEVLGVDASLESVRCGNVESLQGFYHLAVARPCPCKVFTEKLVDYHYAPQMVRAYSGASPDWYADTALAASSFENRSSPGKYSRTYSRGTRAL